MFRVRVLVQIRDEYEAVRDMPAPVTTVKDHLARIETAAAASTSAAAGPSPAPFGGSVVIPGLDAARSAKKDKVSDLAALIDSIDAEPLRAVTGASPNAVVTFKGGAGAAQKAEFETIKCSASVIASAATKWPRPEWHAPWKLYRVISGHQGWVRSVCVEPGNEWFVTGSADRCIKIWDLASGTLKLTLTGHIEQVTGVAVSSRHPYLFSCGLDKKVKCWDLEYNKVIRNYHGHLSGVYCLNLHPELDVLMTGGRDSACRVWDMRTKTQVMCLSGHDNTVGSIISQGVDPQIITGSYDSTIKCWDLAAAKCMSTLTYHKKSIRAMVMHPKEFCFVSASADNIKKFLLPHGKFMHNMLSQQKAIVNTLALSDDNVIASGGDNGTLHFWDYTSGHCFQTEKAMVQPGSMESEAGIFASTFDRTSSRLITVEADKTIKMWKEDPNATPETHPGLPFHPPRDLRRY